jgi:hypothetical protein
MSSRLIVNSIRHTGASGDAVTLANDGTCTANITNNLSNRRLNHNGSMLICQRGNKTGAVQSGYYGLDRYYTQMNDNNNGTWSITQASDVPDGYGFEYSLEYAITSTTSHADRYLMTVYRMEGFDSQVLNYGTSNAKTVTLSFWIKCNKTGNFQVNFENEQNPDAGYQVQQTISSAGTWEKKTVTITGDTSKALTSGSQKAFCFDIVYSAFGTYASATPSAAWSTLSNSQRGGHCNIDLFDSTNNYVKIAGVQLEVGSVATDFEHRSYGQELALCQRYFYKPDIENSSLQPAYQYHVNHKMSLVEFPTTMRATPTSTVTWANTTSSFTHYNSSTSHFKAYNGSAYDDNNSFYISAFQSSAEL